MPLNSPLKHNFQVIDAMPGAGKTEFFVTMANAHLLSKPKEILIYVAPTISLLAETFSRIVKHAKPSDAKALKRIHVVCDHVSTAKFASACTLKGVSARSASCPRDPPAVALNYLLGLLTDEAYAKSKYTGRRPFSKTLTAPAALGDVIITTHEAFMRVLNFDTSGRDFSLVRKCVVVFDEARHCVINSQTIQLEATDRQVMSTCFNLLSDEGVKVKDRIEGEPYLLEYISKLESTDKMMRVLGVDRPTLLPAAVRKLAKQFTDYSANGRAVIYVLSGQTMDGIGVPKSRHTIYTILRPTALFNHYAKVYLTSAFFKDSQMYHFLKKDGHDFTFLLEEAYQPNSPLANIHSRDKKLRSNLMKRLECAVLLRSSVSNARFEYKDTLTSHLLKEGMIVPANKHDSIVNLVNPTLTYTELASRVVGGHSVSSDKSTDKLLSAYAHPPLWVLVREAVSVHRRWCEHLEGKHLALLTINTDKSVSPKWSPLNVGYISVLRAMYKDGYLVPPIDDEGDDGDVSDLVSDEMNSFDALLSPAWRKFFVECVYRKSKDKCFQIPSSPKLHGINGYSGLNAFVHIAALNPDPKLFFVYKKLLPAYQVDQDHSVENLVQMMYRTSLRKPEATEPVLLIVPYASALDLLAQKIYGGQRDFKTVHSPRLMPLSYRRPVADGDRAASALRGSQVAAARRQKYAAEDAQEVNRLRITLLRLRRRATKPGAPINIRANIQKMESRLAELSGKHRRHQTL